MPDLPPLLSKWYSGYYNVSSTRQLHYVFVESLRDPAHDPIMVWFAGGPGGSSMLDLLVGLGPYTIGADFRQNATYNPYAATNTTNVLYLDNPAGVGYSYAGRNIDYIVNDQSFSLDAITFLLSFFQDWPELRSNPLFIAGHSYGGIYAPYLTWKIHLHNKDVEMWDPVNKTGWLNLKGYVVCNGLTGL
jgi:carboxypeptidase C (cathepsin A)